MTVLPEQAGHPSGVLNERAAVLAPSPAPQAGRQSEQAAESGAGSMVFPSRMLLRNPALLGPPAPGADGTNAGGWETLVLSTMRTGWNVSAASPSPNRPPLLRGDPGAARQDARSWESAKAAGRAKRVYSMRNVPGIGFWNAPSGRRSATPCPFLSGRRKVPDGCSAQVLTRGWSGRASVQKPSQRLPPLPWSGHRWNTSSQPVGSAMRMKGKVTSNTARRWVAAIPTAANFLPRWIRERIGKRDHAIGASGRLGCRDIRGRRQDEGPEPEMKRQAEIVVGTGRSPVEAGKRRPDHGPTSSMNGERRGACARTLLVVDRWQLRCR